MRNPTMMDCFVASLLAMTVAPVLSKTAFYPMTDRPKLSFHEPFLKDTYARQA